MGENSTKWNNGQRINFQNIQQLIELNARKKNNLIKKWAKNLNRHFSKEDISSVQFSRSVVSNCLRPHESQLARPPCPSLTPGVHSNSCPSSQWCHPAISSSVIPFSSCPQSLPTSGSFPMSQLSASDDQILEPQLQHQSFQWTSRTDLL